MKFFAKRKKKQIPSTRQMLGITALTDRSLLTPYGELVYFLLKPTNLSVLSHSSINARIYALMNVLKGMAEIEILCINSRENFEDNKAYLKLRETQEENSVLRQLLRQDMVALDQMQIQMATAREFLLVIRLKNQPEGEIEPYLSRIEKALKDQSFDTKRAEKEDLKRLLGVYFEQNVTTEQYEDVDGERWVIGN